MASTKRTIQSAVLLATALFGLVAALPAAEPQSAELKVLSRFVGRWHAKSVSTDGTGQKTESEDDASMRWVVGDSYLEDKVDEKLMGLWTFDRDERVYRCWYFAAGSHKPLVVTMQWNAADTSFSGKADLGNGVTMTTRHRFVGTDKFEFSATVKDATGTVVHSLSGTKTRQPVR
jgi:hypothetical protein